MLKLPDGSKIKSQTWALWLWGLFVVCLSGCHPHTDEGVSSELQRRRGYTPTPKIESVVRTNSGMWRISGQAIPDSRIRLTSEDNQAIGITSNAQGRFSGELDGGENGHVLTLLMQDDNRFVPASYRLFIGGRQEARAAFLGEGRTSRVLNKAPSLIESVDFDAGRSLGISGAASPDQEVTIYLNGRPVWRVYAGKNGRYQAVIDIDSPKPGEMLNLSAQTKTTLAAFSARIQRLLLNVSRYGGRDEKILRSVRRLRRCGFRRRVIPIEYGRIIFQMR